MNTYIGTKIVDAEPMNKYEFYMNVKGIDCKEENQDGYMVIYEDGYVSWSPKDVFEKAYKLLISETFDFGLAIQLLKQGHRVARKGWNGANMFAFYVKPASYPAMMDVIKGVFPNDLVPYRPYLALKTAQNDVATWAPSGSDVLAEDWVVVE